MSFFAELKRRNVIRVAVAYAVASWLLIQVLEIATDAFEAPAWVLKIVMTLLAVGLVPTLVFSWVYELTPDGLKKETDVAQSDSVTAHTAKKLDIAVIGLLVLAIGLFVVDRSFVSSPDSVAENAMQSASSTVDSSAASEMPAASQTTGPPVVAVLPFTARTTGDDDGRFLADGLHDDLLTQLAKLEVFRVVSRTSVLEYLDTPKNMRQIGEELGASAILEGGLQQAGNRVRFNMQLIDAGSDQHLWADTFERELTPENIFAIQAEIARAIASALRATLTEEAAAEIANAPTSNQAAYEAFLLGRLNAYSLESEGQLSSIRQFESATTLDPNYAEAWAWLGLTRLLRAWWDFGITPEDQPLVDGALEAIGRARHLNAELPAADYAEAHYHYWVKADYPKALNMIAPVIKAAPNNGDYIAARAWFNRRAGNWEQAIADLTRAATLDPRNPTYQFELVSFFYQTRQWEKAEAQLEKALQATGDLDTYMGYRANLRLECCGELDGLREFAQRVYEQGRDSQPMVGLMLFERRFKDAITLLREPDPDKSATVLNLRRRALVVALHQAGENDALASEAASYRLDLEALLAEHPDVAPAYEHLGFVHVVLGNADEARKNFAQADELRRPDAVRYGSLVSNRAAVYAISGYPENALDYLEESLAVPAGISWPTVEIDPAFDSLREHPRYKELKRRYSIK